MSDDPELDSLLSFIDENYNMRQLAVESDDSGSELGFAVYRDNEGLKLTEIFKGNHFEMEFSIPEGTKLVATYHTHPLDEHAGMSAGDHELAIEKMKAAGDKLYVLVGTSSELSIDTFKPARLGYSPVVEIEPKHLHCSHITCIRESKCCRCDKLILDEIDPIDAVSGARVASVTLKYSGQFNSQRFAAQSKKANGGRGWWGDTGRHSVAAKKGWGQK